VVPSTAFPEDELATPDPPDRLSCSLSFFYTPCFLFRSLAFLTSCRGRFLPSHHRVHDFSVGTTAFSKQYTDLFYPVPFYLKEHSLLDQAQGFLERLFQFYTSHQCKISPVNEGDFVCADFDVEVHFLLGFGMRVALAPVSLRHRPSFGSLRLSPCVGSAAMRSTLLLVLLF